MLTLDSTKARLALACVVPILIREMLPAQGIFTLTITGPQSVGVPPGEVLRDTYDVLLGHSRTGPGAEAWSFGVTASGAAIVGATTAGTAADLIEDGGLRRGGYEKTETIDPSQNGGRSGAVSSVVLSLGDPIRLPVNALARVATIDVDFGPPPFSSSAKLFFEDGLRGSGPPVNNSVIQEGMTKVPQLVPRGVGVYELQDCCSASLNMGLSPKPLRGTPHSEGLAGLGTLCAALDEVVDHDIDLGPQKVYLNLLSRLDAESGGAQGWVFHVRIDGGGDILSATTAGTIADSKENGGLWSNGFNKTYVTDPAQSIMGLELAATGVILSVTEATTLPLESAESVLVLEVSGPEGATSTLRGFEGSYGEIYLQNLVTVGGDSRPLCNSRTARIRVRHLPRDDFIRGNANGDDGLDIADPVWILNDLFHDGPPSPCGDAADSNDDGRIDISDPVHLIRYLFLTGDAPPAPFAECGLDGTEDDIGCPGGSQRC